MLRSTFLLYSVSHVEPEGNTITASPSVSCNAVCCTNPTKPNQSTNQAFLATTKQQVGKRMNTTP